MRAQAPAQTLLNATVWKYIFEINDVSAAFLHCRAGKNLILEYRICHCLAHSTCIYQKISSHIGAYMVPHAVQKFHYAQNKQNIFLARRRRFCLVSTCVNPSPLESSGRKALSRVFSGPKPLWSTPHTSAQRGRNLKLG